MSLIFAPILHVLFIKLVLAVSEYEYEVQLSKDLLIRSNYSKSTRPMQKVKIVLTIFINQINSIDDSNQLMTSSINIMAKWRDPRLSWDPAAYNFKDSLLIKADQIWQPDLVVLNSASINIFLNLDGKNLAYLSSDGVVAVLYSSASLTTRCAIDVTMFPFDKQTCSIKISSWSMCNHYLSIAFSEVIDDFYVENAVWSLKNTESYNQYEKDRFSYQDSSCVNDVVYFNFHVRRRPLYYMINLIFPSFFLTLLTIACFAIHPISQFAISVTIFLSYSISSVRISSQTPVQSTNMPIVTWYFLVSMCFTLLSFYWFVLDYFLRSISYMPNWVAHLCVKVRSCVRFVRDRVSCGLTRESQPLKLEEIDHCSLDAKDIKQEQDCAKCRSCPKCRNKEIEEKLNSQQKSEFDRNMLCLNRVVFSVLFSLIFLFNLICWICVSSV